MALGPLKIEAADVLFRWLKIPLENRQEMWLNLKQIDSLYMKHQSERDKEEREQNPSPPKRPIATRPRRLRSV